MEYTLVDVNRRLWEGEQAKGITVSLGGPRKSLDEVVLTLKEDFKERGCCRQREPRVRHRI